MSCLQTLIRRESLTEDDAYRLFGAMLAGQLDEPMIAAILALLAAKGPTVDECTGAARVMRAHVTPVPFTPASDERLIDTCGTGGAPKTYNISTAAAIIAASAKAPVRVLVAKHGNKSRTGRGSAEVLNELGVGVEASPEVQAHCLRETGVCFCFAIHHHPAMRHAGAIRRALGVPTIFNALGPLTNPAGASRQLIGVYAPDLVELLAHTLVRLGSNRAMVVHGDDGLDELTTSACSSVAIVENGTVRTQRVDPAALGLEPASLEALRASSVQEAAVVIREVLDGQQGPKREIAVLNAAGALVVAGAAESFEQGLEIAREAIDSGRASKTLAALARVSRTARPPSP